MVAGRIVVLNPNANPEVTRGLDAAVAPLRFAGGPEIVCETLEEGPFGIEHQAEVDAVALPLARRVAAGDADAWVVACFADPGLAACREVARAPVFGIAESGMFAALQRGERPGVVAMSRRAVPRHRRHRRMLGVDDRIVGERALELTVGELHDETATWRRLADVALELREEDEADVIVLGCAGLSRYRHRLEHELGVPVIDPTLAAVATALGVAATATAQA